MSSAVDRGGRPLGVQEAYDALGDYAGTYGELPLRLLLHAAVPQSFRADLLNLLKVNFVPEAGGDLSVDADVLLSPLVEATAAGYFRLDPEVRRQALDLLDAVYRHEGSRRSIRVARFLIAWLDRLEQVGAASIDPLLAEYAVIQRWVALALIDPPTVAAALAVSLRDSLAEEKSAVRARLGGIATALSIPLSGHQPLLSYAQGIDALRTRNADEARRLLEPLGNSEIRIGDVTLRPAADLLDAYLPREIKQPPLGPSASTKEPIPAGGSRAILINVPPQPDLFIGREREFQQGRAALLQPLMADAGVTAERGDVADVDAQGGTAGSLIVALVGPDGIGSFTLARALVHDRQVQERYPDGIIWLSEGGADHPFQLLGDYLTRAGAGTEGGVVDEDAFRQWLLQRRVLFVADQRDALDFLASLKRITGPSCAILWMLRDESLASGATATVRMTPLAPSDAEKLSNSIQSWTPQVDALIVRAAAGNPLLIRLLNNAMHFTMDTHQLIFGGVPGRFEAHAGQVAEVASRDLGEACSIICGEMVSALATNQRTALYRLLEAQEWRTQILKAAWDKGLSLVSSELRRGLISDELGDVVRVHPLVRDALHALAPEEEKAEPRPDVAVCYAHEDEKFGGRLWKDLASRGIHAVDLGRGNEPSAGGFLQGLSSFRALVVVLSEAALDSPRVLAAVDKALRSDIRVIPVLAAIPSPRILSSRLASLQWIDAHGSADYEVAVDQLVKALGSEQTLVMPRGWPSLLSGINMDTLTQRILPEFLPGRRWFAAKGSAIRTIKLRDEAVLRDGGYGYLIGCWEVTTADGTIHTYGMPLATAWETPMDDPSSRLQGCTLARVMTANRLGVLYDALGDAPFTASVLRAIVGEEDIETAGGGKILFRPTKALAAVNIAQDVEIRWLGGEQSNTSMRIGEDAILKVYRPQSNTSMRIGEDAILKVYRRLQAGVHPEIEMGRFLTDIAGYQNAPATLGSFEFLSPDGTPTALGVLHQFTRNQGDGWTFTLDYLTRFLQEIEVIPEQQRETEEQPHALYRALAATLGQRVAELHQALAIETDDPAFQAEAATADDIHRWGDSVREQAVQARDVLGRVMAGEDLSEPVRERVQDLLRRWQDVEAAIGRLVPKNLAIRKSRFHGDLHLGQVVVVREDFLILDFEGEPARPLEERRSKHSPMRDVAGMMRSFNYAGWSALREHSRASPPSESVAMIVQQWEALATESFLAAYRQSAEGCPTIPADDADFQQLLALFSLEKALYEICYEASNRPDWLGIPVRGVLQLIGSAE